MKNENGFLDLREVSRRAERERDRREMIVFLRIMLAFALFGLWLFWCWSFTEHHLSEADAGLNRMELGVGDVRWRISVLEHAISEAGK